MHRPASSPAGRLIRHARCIRLAGPEAWRRSGDCSAQCTRQRPVDTTQTSDALGLGAYRIRPAQIGVDAFRSAWQGTRHVAGQPGVAGLGCVGSLGHAR